MARRLKIASPPRIVRLASPAKVNLFLEVTGRRPDGYHRITTLFVKVGLCDLISVEAAGGPGPVKLELVNRSRTQVPEGPENLAVRAAEAYRRRFRIKTGLRIRLVKRIPAGGGLGGGSSNAGTVLRAMGRLFPGPGRDQALPGLGSQLGADVPLFTREGGVFLGKGIGERLEAVAAGAAFPPLVLVYPGVPVSTADAYRKLTLPRRESALTSHAHLDKLLIHLAEGNPPSLWAKLLFNRLEEAVLPFYPEVAEAKRVLLSLGAGAALVSGSGSCVFAVVRTPAEGRRLLGRLRPWRHWSSWLVGCGSAWQNMRRFC